MTALAKALLVLAAGAVPAPMQASLAAGQTAFDIMRNVFVLVAERQARDAPAAASQPARTMPN